MKKLTVLDELLRRLRKMIVNLSSQIVYLTKTTECDKIEELVTPRGKVKKEWFANEFTNCLLDKSLEM